MTELRECECGREPTILRRKSLIGGLFRVVATRIECMPCEVSTQAWHDTEELAISAWNRRADDWQPIETAPRDGTEVLTWDGMSTRVLHWFEGVHEALWINEEGTPCEGASHWRPLPKGPGG